MVKIKLTPKLILGTLFLLVIALAIFISNNRPLTQLTLTAAENKFNVKFQISKYDQNSAESFAQEVGLPKNILNGFEFSLDGTSSARLAYISPIKTDLKFQKEKLQFSGTTKMSLLTDSFSPDRNFKAPQEFSVALFGKNFLPLIEKKVILPPDFKKWLDTNLKNTSGQYLFLFGDKPDFALIFKKDLSVDFENLESRVLPDSYKEETQDNITFHLVKIREEDNEQNYVFFEMGDQVFVTSSLGSAKELVQSQKSASVVPNVFGKDPVAVAIVVQNAADQKAGTALKFLLGGEQKLTSHMDKIKTFRLILKNQEFWGYLDFSDDK